MPTIASNLHPAANGRRPPVATWDVADLDAIRSDLSDARIKLAGTISEQDFRYVLKLRRTLLQVSGRLRRIAATGGMFPFEYRSGANDALRAAQLLGRANAIMHEVHGELGLAADRSIDRRLQRALRSAKFALDQAYIAAHTGTHP